MSYKNGDAVTVEFCTQHPTTGAATNGDSLPVGTFARNGTDDGTVAVTATNVDTGRYKAAFTIPAGAAAGDTCTLSIAATVNAIVGKGIVWQAVIDTKRAADISATLGAAGAGLTALGDTRLANLDATVSSRGTSTYAGGAVASVTSGVTVSTNNDKTGYSLSTGGVQAIWDALTSALTTAGSIGKRLADFVTTLVYAAPPSAAPTAAQVRAEIDSNSTQLAKLGTPAVSVSADIAAVAAKTGNLPASPAAVGSAMTLDLSQALSVSPTTGTTGHALAAALSAVGKVTYSPPAANPGTGTITVYAKDGTTVLVAQTVTTDASGNVVSRI